MTAPKEKLTADLAQRVEVAAEDDVYFWNEGVTPIDPALLECLAGGDRSDPVEEIMRDGSDSDEDSCSEELELPQDVFSRKIQSAQSCHENCIDKFDGIYPENADPAKARKFDDDAVTQVDRIMRHDMCTTFVRPGGSRVIPAGVNARYAVCLVVDAGVDTHGQVDPHAASCAAAQEYVQSVIDNIESAETIDEVRAMDEAFCVRADMDTAVADAGHNKLEKVIKRKMKKLRKHVEEKKRQAEEQKDDPVDKAREELERATGLKPEPALAKAPQVTSMLRPRPVDSITAYGGVVTGKGMQLTAHFERPDVLEKHTEVAAEIAADEAKRRERDELEKHKRVAAEMGRVGLLFKLLEADEQGLTVDIDNLKRALLIAGLTGDALTKKQRKAYARGQELFRKLTGHDVPIIKDSEGRSNTLESLEHMIEMIGDGYDADSLHLDAARLRVYLEHSAQTERTGVVGQLPPGERGKMLLKLEQYVEYHTRPRARPLKKLIALSKKTPALPLMRELQRSIAETESLIDTLKTKGHDVTGDHPASLAKARELIAERSDKSRPLAELLEADDVALTELDAALAAAKLHPDLDEQQLFQKADMLCAKLVVQATYDRQRELERLHKEAKERIDEKCTYDFTVKLYVADVSNPRSQKPEWFFAKRQNTIRTTGACAVSTDTDEVVVGRTRGVSVYALPTGTRMLDLKLDKSWGGRVINVSCNSRFVCGVFDFPKGMAPKTTCSGFVYNRYTQKLHIVDPGAVPISTIEPDSNRDVYWLATTAGSIFAISWEKASLDEELQCILIAASIAPIRRVRRIGRRLHAIAGSDLFSWDVQPLEGETLDQMATRAGRPRRHPLGFPSDVSRWGPVIAVLQRDYKLRLICGDMVRVLPGTTEQQERANEKLLHPFPWQQFVHFDGDTIRILYGDGTVRAVWPGSTASQYESDSVRKERQKFAKLMQLRSVDTDDE